MYFNRTCVLCISLLNYKLTESVTNKRSKQDIVLLEAGESSEKREKEMTFHFSSFDGDTIKTVKCVQLERCYCLS